MNKTEIIHEIELCFISQEAYAKIKKYKDLFKEQQSVITPIICEAIQSTMTEGTPMSKLLSLRLCKELMDLKAEIFVRQVQEKLLSKMIQIATFRKHDQSEMRGKFLFSDNPTKETASIGNSLMKLCLDCIKVWAIWFPQSDYKQAYDDLIAEGVQFPAKFTYFKEFNDTLSSLGQSFILSSHSSKEPPIKQQVVKTKIDAKQLQLLIRQEFEFLDDILKGKETEESANYLRQLMNNLEQFKPQLEQQLMQILESGEEALINDLVLKQDIIETLIAEYQQYLNRKVNWTQLVKTYQKICPGSQQTPQPPVNSVLQPPKQKIDQTLSIIREETNNDENPLEKSKQQEMEKSQQQQLKIVPQQSITQNNELLAQQVKQDLVKAIEKKQVYKSLSLDIDDDNQEKVFKQADEKNKKQSKLEEKQQIPEVKQASAKLSNQFVESNPMETKQIEEQSQSIEQSKSQQVNNVNNLQNTTSLQPAEEIDEIIVEELQPQQQPTPINQNQLQTIQVKENSVSSQLKKQQSIKNNTEQQENTLVQLKTNPQQTLLLSQQQKLQQQQDLSGKIETIETPVNQIQESRINQRKIQRIKVDPFLTLDIPQEMDGGGQRFEQQQSLSLSQVSQRRNNSVQPSRGQIGKRETYATERFELELLRDENIQLKQDISSLRDQYERKQKQHTQEIENKITEIARLTKILHEFDLDKTDNRSHVVQQFQETEKLSLELQTLQYKYKQLQQQYAQLQREQETLQRDISLKSKQIQMQNTEISQLKQRLTQDQENKKRSESVGQYSKTAQQFYPYQQSLKDPDFDIPQLTESQKHLIYPFTNPYEYYRDRLKNNQKGIVAQQYSEWLRVNLDLNNKTLLKTSILSNQSMLYTNKQLEIGCKMEKINESTILLHLYFMNANKLSNYKIDCQFQFPNEVITRALKRKSFQLQQDSSEDIEVEYCINVIPFGLSIMNVTMSQGNNSTQSIYLPITIFSFIKFMNTNLREYQLYWKRAKMSVVRSDSIQYNKEVLKDIFSKYFPVIELNSHKKREFLAGIDEIKYGSIISCKGSSYLIRYVLQPNNLMVIQIALLQGRQNCSEFILNNFIFLFSK